MQLVGLPFGAFGCMENQATSRDAKSVQDMLHFRHAIEVPVKCMEGNLYVRISAHVYNELEDYERLGRAILQEMQSS
jgi:isopenicillin-N epimerase